MRIVAFDGSLRRDGPLAVLLRGMVAELQAQGFEAELLYLERNPLTGCCMCGQCANKRDDRCSRPPEDGLRRCARKLRAADGIVIASPSYSAGCSPAVQRLMMHMERGGREGGASLAGKVAAAVIGSPGGVGGGQGAQRGIERWLLARQMVVVGTASVDLRGGRGTGDQPGGPEGMDAVIRLARAMARRLKPEA